MTLAGAPGLANPPESIVASAVIGNWKAQVVSTGMISDRPQRRNEYCILQTRGMRLLVLGDGDIEPRFLPPIRRNEDGSPDLTHLLVTSIRIDDGTPYQAMAINNPPFPAHFSDIDYGPEHDDGLIRGSSYLGVRKIPGSPWLTLNALAGELISGHTLRIRFRLPRAGGAGKTKRYTIHAGRMAAGLKWCQDTMDSATVCTGKVRSIKRPGARGGFNLIDCKTPPVIRK